MPRPDCDCSSFELIAIGCERSAIDCDCSSFEPITIEGELSSTSSDCSALKPTGIACGRGAAASTATASPSPRAHRASCALAREPAARVERARCPVAQLALGCGARTADAASLLYNQSVCCLGE